VNTARKSAILASTILMGVSAPAWAEDAAQSSNEAEIVVTAARTILPANALPLTVDIIDNDDLVQQSQIGGSVIDAVSSLTPSFSPTRQKLSGAGETLRGRSPLYAINGIPQTTPLRDGSRDGFTIDPFFVDRVEVIFGSNALQGIGGSGGIINQVTVGAPKEDGLSGRTLAQATFDNELSGAGFGWKTAGLLSYKAGRFDGTFGAAFEKRGIFLDGDGRIVGFNGTQGEIQDSKTLSLFARLGYDLGGDARVDVIASRFKLDGDGDYVLVNGNRTTGLPTSAVRGVQPGIPARGLAESVSLSITDGDLAGGNLVTQVFASRTRDTFGGGVFPDLQDPLIPPFGTLFDQSENRSRKLGAKFSYERALPGFEALTATVGFDALLDRTEQVLITTGRGWVPQTDFRSLAPFAQANLALFDEKLRLAGGIRSENVRIKIPDYTTLAFYGRRAVSGGAPKFTDTLLNGGIVFEPIDGIRAYASYAEGYTVPDVGRITRAISLPNIDIDTFLDISPIISNNKEIGVEVKKGPLDASATYFWSTSNNGQLLVLVNNVFQVQRQRIELQGLELNLGVQMPVEGLKLSAGYAHLYGRSDSNGDGVVDIDLDGGNISPDRLNLAASFDRGNLSARLQTQFYFARNFRGIDQRNNFGGYTLTDAYVRYRSGFGGISASVSNLFDKQYISYNSDTTQPTNNAVFFAGRGRTFSLAWDYRF
jgi:iron complex outermembrane receptor protein